MCAGAMVHARVKRLVYGAADLKTGAADSVFRLLDSNQLNHQVEIVGGILGETCGALLSAFFRQRRREHKAQKRLQNKNPEVTS